MTAAAPSKKRASRQLVTHFAKKMGVKLQSQASGIQLGQQKKIVPGIVCDVVHLVFGMYLMQGQKNTVSYLVV